MRSMTPLPLGIGERDEKVYISCVAYCLVMLARRSHEASAALQTEIGVFAASQCLRLKAAGLDACAFGREGTASDRIWRFAGQEEASCDVHLMRSMAQSVLRSQALVE